MTLATKILEQSQLKISIDVIHLHFKSIHKMCEATCTKNLHIPAFHCHYRSLISDNLQVDDL